MKTLNLVYPEKSEIEYTLTTFPDGEPHIVLNTLDVKEDVYIKCRVRNPNELYILLQVLEILNRNGIYPIVKIGYLMSMRMDRVMNYNRPYSLKIVCDLLNNYKAKYDIFQAHSNKIESLLDNTSCFQKPFCNIFDVDDLVIYPDRSANIKCYIPCSKNIIINKKRDVNTGIIKIDDFSTIDKEKLDESKSISIVDDLVDGGATICSIIDKIREYVNCDIPIKVFVSHSVNRNGLVKLLFKYKNIDIHTTNSYEDWDKVFPNVENLHVKNIFD